MTKRFQTSARLELKLPLSVIENCWLMNVNSELCLTAFSSDSVRLNIFLEKSNEHVKLLFAAFEGVPYFEVLSDEYKCCIETVLGSETSVESSRWHSASMNRVTQLNPFPRGKASGSGNLQHDRNKKCDGFDHAHLNSTLRYKEVDGLGGELPSEKIQIKEECSDRMAEWNRSSVEVPQSAHRLSALKSEEETFDFSSRVSETLRDTDSESNSDTISLSHDEDDNKDEEYLPGIVPLQRTKQDKTMPNKVLKPKLSKQGVCPHCGVYYGNLSQHIFTYCSKNPGRVKAFHCCYCKYRTHNKDELMEHKTSHVLMRDFKCEICDSGFFTRQRLIRHKRYVHLVGNNPVKIYTCSVCEKHFRYRSHYDRHLTIHQDEKSVQCEMCGKFFKNKHNVHNHQSRMHPLKVTPATYPYYCEKCGEGFLHLGSHRCSEPRRTRTRNSTFDQGASDKQDLSSQMPSEDPTTTRQERIFQYLDS